MEREAADVPGQAARQPAEASGKEIGGVRRRRGRVGRQPDHDPEEAGPVRSEAGLLDALHVPERAGEYGINAVTRVPYISGVLQWRP